MNREDTKKAVAVMQAWLDGAEIQYRDRLYQEREFKGVAGTPLWSWSNNEYRIKPSPREFWVNTEEWILNEKHESPLDMTGWILCREVCDD